MSFHNIMPARLIVMNCDSNYSVGAAYKRASIPTAMEANMNHTNKNRPSLIESARELRRESLSKLLDSALARFSESRRSHHEAWLRRSAMRTPRMKSAIGTPA